MSDDSFIREVEEEIRSERLQDFWAKWGKFIIAAAVAFIAAIAVYNYLEYARATKAAEQGDAFMAAVTLAEDGKTDEALADLQALEQDGTPAYRALARLRAASELVKKGEEAKAVEEFDAVAADDEIDTNLRSIARLRAGYVLVDTGSLDDVLQRVGPLSGDSNPYRYTAQEITGLAHFKAGDLQKAFAEFEALGKADDLPSAMRQRVIIMLGVIASRGGPVLELPNS